MIALKKLYGDELLRLALMLSLLRADPEQYLRSEEARLLAGGLVNGTERSPEISEYYHRSRTLHPKSIDSIILDYERDIFEEMMSLGRWGNTRSNHEAVQAYLLNGVESAASQQAVAAIAQNSVAQDLYSHLPIVQLDDAEVEQCVTIKTENDTSDEDLYEEVVCLTPDSAVEQEIEIKSEESDEDLVASNYHTHLSSALGPSFIRNLSTFDGPLLEDDSAASAPFDVTQFFSDPSPVRKFVSDVSKSLPLFYDENAIDDFMPYYLQNSGGDSIRDQNLADLRDYNENRETLEEFKRQIEGDDFKEQKENYDQYLLQNTELDHDFEPVPFVKRERASTSFTSVASSSGVSEAEACASGSSSSNESSFFGNRSFKIEKDEGLYSGDDLTPEDMDLIEVLWKQDVDMGFCLNSTQNQGDIKCPLDEGYPFGADGQTKLDDDHAIEKLKIALEDEVKNIDVKLDTPIDPWDGIPHTVDTETGEYVLSGDLPERFDLLEEALQLVDLDDAGSNLHGELKDEQSPPSEQQKQEEEGEEKEEEEERQPEMLAPRYHPHPHGEHHALPPPDQQQHHHHAVHHHFAAAYHHQNLVRSVSMEQRWQDLAALLALPGPNPPAAALAAPGDHHPHHLYNQHHHHHVNSTLGHCSQGSSPYVGSPYAPISEKPPLGTATDIYGSPNLGSAVAASMNVSHGPSGCAATGGGPPPFYKAEHPPHEHHQPDPMYYQNGTNELNGTSDGFLSSILNDEDLQLMDMAMNEGMYTMRMLESGGAAAAAGGGPVHLPHQTQPPHSMSNHHINMGSERIDASSDSAVSSMGSERVPSLSDGEWCDAGSDSAQDFHSKLRPCENESRQAPLVAQKKHHMFGKRCFQDQTQLGRLRNSAHDDHPMSDVKYEYEQPSAPASAYIPDVGHMAPEMKYSCTMEFTAGGAGVGVPPSAGGLRHNHTYSLPPAPPQPPHRPLARDKRGRRGLEASGLSACGSQGPLSRDEKKARALGIPMTVHDIINLPMDEFNERLSKHDLSETQLSLIRDIRRRGKNKVAAQNCRKRKLDQITSLADEVRDARLRKQRLQRDRHLLLAQRQRAKEHFAALYRHVFQHLRDNDGNPLSSQQYSLQQAADGAVVLVPRASASLLPDSRSPRSVDRHMSSNGTSDDDLDRIKIKQRKSFDQ